MQNFIFGESTPWTYNQLQEKRAVANALLARKRAPQNVGEGLNAIGEALLYRSLNKRIGERESHFRNEADNKWNAAFGQSQQGWFGDTAPSREQLFAIMSDPYMSDAQKGYAQAVLSQQMPMSEMERANLELIRAKTASERATHSQTAAGGPKWKIVELADGRKYYVDELGAEQPRLVNPEIEAKPDGYTESEQKLVLFRNMQEEAAPVLEKLEGVWDPANLGDHAASWILGGNYFKTPEGRQYSAVASAWAEGALRIATGAAATEDEIRRTIRTYFAQPGDDAGTIEIKRNLRAMYQRSINVALQEPGGEGTLALPADFAAQIAGNKETPSISEMTDDEFKNLSPERVRKLRGQDLMDYIKRLEAQ